MSRAREEQSANGGAVARPLSGGAGHSLRVSAEEGRIFARHGVEFDEPEDVDRPEDLADVVATMFAGQAWPA